MIFTARKRSCGKVTFLHLSVSHSVHRGREGLPSPPLIGRPGGLGRPPRCRPPWADPQADPLDADPSGQTVPPRPGDPPGCRLRPQADPPRCRPTRQTPWMQTPNGCRFPPGCRAPWMQTPPGCRPPPPIRQQAVGTHPTGIYIFVHTSFAHSFIRVGVSLFIMWQGQ